MPAAALPLDETARLEALRALGILDSAPDAEFDAIVSAASLACGVSVAILGLIDESREWFKAQVGMPGVSEAPREISFCSYTILSDGLLEVEDATRDPRFADNPAVTGEPHIRFYAAAPLLLHDGSAVGALCVVDQQPRRLTEAQRDILRSLAGLGARCLENWRVAHMLGQTARDLKASDERLRRLYEATPAMLHSIDEQGVLLAVSDTWLGKLGYSRDEVLGRRFADFLMPESRRRSFEEAMPRFFAEGLCEKIAYQMVRKDGEVIDIELSAIVDREAGSDAPRSLTVIEDVTLRRRAELALVTEHRRMANIIESSGMGTWEWNVQTGDSRCSERWAALIGWTLAELPPRTAHTRRERIHPDDWDRVEATIAQHLAGQSERFEVELRIRHREGHWVWMLDHGAVISRTEDGRPEWLFGTRTDVSERKRQEEALRKSEELLDRTGRVAGVGGWELDLLTREVGWSAETRRIHGVPADYEPKLETAIDFYPPEVRPIIEDAVARSLTFGEGWDLEVPFIRWDGSPIWVRTAGTITFVDGKPVRVSGALQDVTQQVARRLELERANERIRLATESGGIGIWEWDVVRDTVTLDTRTCEVCGIDPTDRPSTYAGWARCLHADDRAATERAIGDAVAERRPYDVEFRVVWGDGSLHYVRSAARVTRDSQGRPQCMIGVIWDVTAAHLLAAERRQAEVSEREAALFRNSPDVLSVVRVEEAAGETVFVYEAVSPAIASVTGWQPEDLVGRRPEACLPPDAAGNVVADYKACIATDGTITRRVELATARGKREFEGSLTPIRDPASGKIVRLASAMRDVTDHNRLLADQHHSQKMEAMGLLASGVAHDFNNILQSVSGSLEMVQDELPAGTLAHDFAAVGLRAAKRGAYLTHHLLSYARKQTLQPKDVDLPSLLADVETLLTRTLGSTISVTVRADAAARTVHVDPGQIQTALLNLAINASHAMTGGGSLLIESHAAVEAGRPWVTIAITDTGTGMDAATLARAVEPFFTTKGLSGTGLGLSMVQGFAEQSGGRLSIASVLGQGTTVALHLPVVLEQCDPDPAAPAVYAAPRSGCILLVDDDPDVLVTTGAFLDKAGFTCVRAGNANEALALLAKGTKIDAIVTDYAMPGMNGGDLVAEVRLGRPGLPAVVISGFTDLADTTSLGEDVTMLHKPFPRHLLIATLLQLLGGTPSLDAEFASLQRGAGEA